MQNLLRIISTISVVLCFPQNMNAQTIDYAVKVASGFVAISADRKIEIVEGFAAISADQKWEIIGACSNRPNLTVEIVEGFAAISADQKIEIVEGFAAISADKKICITNPRELDREILRKLKLMDQRT